MVHIINGEIVQDDDPRVLARKQPQSGAAGNNAARRRPVTGMNSLGDSAQSSQQQAQHQTAQAGGGGSSPMQGLKRMLCLDGTVTIPGFLGVAPRPVEKIYLALSVLSVVVFGWQALIFLGLGFCLTSQRPAAAPPQRQ